MATTTTPTVKTLVQIGLSEKEATVYEALLALGKAGMGKLLNKVPYKRGNTYDIVKDLIQKGLVSESAERGKMVFVVEPPDQLKQFIATGEQRLQQQKKSLQAHYEQLASTYRLALHKPGVRFFEGVDGIKDVLMDTVTNNASKKLLTFSDVAGYTRYLKEWNANTYALARKKAGVFEQVIIPNHPAAMEYMRGYKANELTEILFIDHALYPFTTEINMYDDKVSFVTFSEKSHIGVIVENKEIFETLCAIFRFSWEVGKTTGQFVPAKSPTAA